MTRHGGAMRVAWYALLGVAFAVPLAIAGLGPRFVVGLDVYNLPKLLVLSVLLAVSAGAWAYAVIRSGIRVRFAWPLWIALAFLGFATVSALLGVDRSSALLGSPVRQGLISMVLLFIVAFLGVQLARGGREVRTLALAVVAGGVAIAALALLQVAGVFPAQWVGESARWMLARGISTLGNPDHLGGHLVMPMVLAAACALGEERPRVRAALWGAFALVAVAWFATLTRGAWLGGALGLTLLAVAVRRGGVALRRLDLGALTVSAIAVLAAVALRAEPASRRAVEMLDLSREGASGRFIIWESALSAAREHWLVGVGPDSFKYAYLPFRSAEHAVLGGSAVSADDAHNYLLMLAVTVGVPGLLLGLAFLGAVMRGAFRFVGAATVAGTAGTTGANRGRIVYAGWLAAVVAHCGYLFFGPASLGSSAVLWLAFGVLLSPVAKQVEAADSRMAWVPTATAAVIATAAVATALIVLPMFASNTQLLQSARATGPDAIAWAQRARATMPWVAENRFRVAEASGQLAFAYARQGRSPQGVAAANDAVAAYERLLETDAHDYEVNVVYADVLNGLAPILGDRAAQRALELATAAEELYPAGMHWRVQAATALVLLERPDEAITLLAAVWDSDPYYVEPATRYAWALLKAGRVDEGRDVVGRMLELYPDEPFAREFAQQFEVEAQAQQQDR